MGKRESEKEREREVPWKFNFDSDEFLISAWTMCLAPASPILLSSRTRDEGEYEHKILEEDEAMGGERMRAMNRRGATQSESCFSIARQQCAWPQRHQYCTLEENEQE